MPRKHRVAKLRTPIDLRPELLAYLSERFDFFGDRSVVIEGTLVTYNDATLRQLWETHRRAITAECERRFGPGTKPWPFEAYPKLQRDEKPHPLPLDGGPTP